MLMPIELNNLPLFFYSVKSGAVATHSFNVPKPLKRYLLIITSSLVTAILCISLLCQLSAELTPHILQRDRISISFPLLPFFSVVGTYTLRPCNSVGTSTA